MPACLLFASFPGFRVRWDVPPPLQYLEMWCPLSCARLCNIPCPCLIRVCVEPSRVMYVSIWLMLLVVPLPFDVPASSSYGSKASFVRCASCAPPPPPPPKRQQPLYVPKADNTRDCQLFRPPN